MKEFNQLAKKKKKIFSIGLNTKIAIKFPYFFFLKIRLTLKGLNVTIHSLYT